MVTRRKRFQEHAGNQRPAAGDHTISIDMGVTPGPTKPAETMTTAELKKEVDRLALILRQRQQPDKQDRDLGIFADAVYTKINEVLGGAITGNVGPLSIRQLFQSAETWGPILAFLEQAGYLTMTPAEKVAVYGYLAELVVRHAYTVSKRSRAPMSPKLVANCSGNLGGLFEREFPGYLRRGHAGIVARRLCMALS